MMLSTDDFSADDLPSVIYVAEGSAAEKRCKERGWYYKTYRY